MASVPASTAHCGCGYHAAEGRPCEHDKDVFIERLAKERDELRRVLLAAQQDLSTAHGMEAASSLGDPFFPLNFRPTLNDIKRVLKETADV